MHGASVHPNNVWTLYLRSMLLLHHCILKRADRSLSDGQRAQFAMQAWVEIDAIEDALNKPWRPLPAGRVTEAQARALRWAARRAQALGDGADALVVLAGSLYLVADFYRLLQKLGQADEIWGAE